MNTNALRKILCWLLGYWLFILCWLVRLFGGSHKWRRLHKNEGVPDVRMVATDGSVAYPIDTHPERIRICNRCGTPRVAKKRQRKGV